VKHSTNSLKSNLIASTISFILILALIALVPAIKQDSQVYPPFIDILEEFWRNISDFSRISAFLLTIIRVVITLVASLLTALILSLLYYYNKITYAFFKPFLVIAKSAPIAAISVYLFITVGGKFGPYVIAYLVTMPVMVEAFINAIDQVPEGIKNELAITNNSKFYKFTRIYLPLISKSILSSLLQTIGLGFKVMIMGEYICQTKKSIGVLIYNSFSFLEMDVLISVIISVVIIVVIWELFIKKIEKKYI